MQEQLQTIYYTLHAISKECPSLTSSVDCNSIHKTIIYIYDQCCIIKPVWKAIIITYAVADQIIKITKIYVIMETDLFIYEPYFLYSNSYVLIFLYLWHQYMQFLWYILSFKISLFSSLGWDKIRTLTKFIYFSWTNE